MTTRVTGKCPWCRQFNIEVSASGRGADAGPALTAGTKRHLAECRTSRTCQTCGCGTGTDEESCTTTRCWCETQPNVHEWHAPNTFNGGTHVRVQ